MSDNPAILERVGAALGSLLRLVCVNVLLNQLLASCSPHQIRRRIRFVLAAQLSDIP